VNLAHVDAETWVHVSQFLHSSSSWSKLYLPPAVLSRRPHLSHLKCFAFWWLIKIFKSSKSRSQ